MKIKMEIDISPQEVLELFEGNVESLQKAMLGTIAHSYDQAVKNNDFQPQQIFDFWQGMAEKAKRCLPNTVRPPPRKATINSFTSPR